MFKVIFRRADRVIIVIPITKQVGPSLEQQAEFIEYLESQHKAYNIVKYPPNTEVEFIN
ncbi:hypothetical protein [Staphylococcus americanisciuri]|uniref:Uncharacterized protein n=1 Tax=Staphylococcus americanisciuri TaxID=2973940 RepID=A0ABT2F2J4_9STAP|nr:hypothetical protein [Staphylococcus americanisciuri]MCS4486373.1 hypothetical protein [Staphylococcus americanisciuri]